MNSNTLYLIALSRVKGIGPTVAKTLVSYCGGAQQVFNTPVGKLARIPGVGTKLISSLRNIANYLPEAESILKQAKHLGATVLTYTDAQYPYRLKQIADAPNVLYYNGNADLQQTNCISVVGTRHATAYGRELTQHFIDAWRPYQPLIVSGLAYGIDISAHKAALHNNLTTLGVMASGLDIIYPSQHARYAQQMLKNGGLLTEHPFGTKPDAYYFPARNRIIAGISQATVVVEATLKGGAQITAHLARDYDREVYALPGPWHSETSKGCHQLVRQQVAQILTDPEQLVEELGWKLPGSAPAEAPAPDFSQLPAQQQAVLQLLQTQPEGWHLDMLVYKSGLNFSALASILLELEFSGWVRSLPGKKYQLARK